MAICEVHYYFIECDDCPAKYVDESDDVAELIEWAKKDGWQIKAEDDGVVMSVCCPTCVGRTSSSSK